MPSSQSSKTGVLGSGTGVLGSGPRVADPSVITGGTSTATSTPSSTLPATAPSNFLVIPGRIPSNDLNMANVSQFMRTTYYNASMYAAPTVIGARLKQNVTLRDIIGRESLLQRRQQQLSVLDDQISNYHAEFGSRLNDKALDFLNKMANINVPTFTSILAGFENARASRADMEQKRISDLERIMTLDQQLQRDRMALRKEQMDAENMVANAMLEARTGQLKAYDDIAGKGVALLAQSGQGTTLPIPQNVHSSDITPRAQGFSGLGGSAGTAAQRARAGQLATIMGGAKAGSTGATVTGEAATTGTTQEQVRPMQGETMSEVYVPASGDRNLLMALAVWKSGYDTEVATGRRPVTDMNGKNFAGAKKTLTDYFAANPDKLAVLKQYDPNAEQWLNSDDPAVFYKGFHDSWERGYKTRVGRALQSNGQPPSKYPGISETPAQTTTTSQTQATQATQGTATGGIPTASATAGATSAEEELIRRNLEAAKKFSPAPTQSTQPTQPSTEDPLRSVTPQQQSTGQPTSQATPVTNRSNTGVLARFNAFTSEDDKDVGGISKLSRNDQIQYYGSNLVSALRAEGFSEEQGKPFVDNYVKLVEAGADPLKAVEQVLVPQTSQTPVTNTTNTATSNQPGIIGQAVEGAQMAASDAWRATKNFLGNVANNVVDFAGGSGVAYAGENPAKSSEDLAVQSARESAEYNAWKQQQDFIRQRDLERARAESAKVQGQRITLTPEEERIPLRQMPESTVQGGDPVLSQPYNSASTSQTTTGIPTGQPAASFQRNIPQDTGVLYPEMNSTSSGEGLGTRLANAYREGWEGARMWASDAWGQIKDGFNQDMEAMKGAVGGPTAVGVSDAGIARAYEGMGQSPYENWNVSSYDDPYAYGPRPMETEPVAEPVMQATSQPDNFIDRERATNRIRDALDTKLEQTYPSTILAEEDPNRFRIRDKLEQGVRQQGRYGTVDADFVDQAFAAGYSEDDVINTLTMNFPPGYDRMAYLRRVARPVTEYVGLPENLERNPYEELSEGMTPQFNYSDEFGLPEMPGTQAEAQPAQPAQQPEAQGGGYAADAESMAGMIETPDVNVDAGTTPTLPAQSAPQPVQPAPQNAEFFQDANTYMRQYAQPQPPVQYTQPPVQYTQPPVQYTQPPVQYAQPQPPQNYIPGGTTIAVGRMPQVDPYMARGVDPYGNFYPLPGQAQGYGRYRRPDDWTVINEYDRRLRNQNDLDLEAVGAAFRQWFLNNAGGPPAQFYPSQAAPTGSNFNYMPPRYYPQERYTVPQYQLSPEQQQLIESKLQNLQLQRQQRGVSPNAPLTQEESQTHGITQEELDALAMHYDAIRTASAYGNAMADVPAANQVYMTNAGLQRQAQGQVQAQLPPGAYNTYGNVKPLEYIKTKSGVSLQGMNDELMNRMNRMAQILKDEFGMDLTISSGRRTQAEQVALHRRGKNRAAAPGHSPHQQGNAFDVAIDSSMIPQFNRNQKAQAMFGRNNFNAFWNYVVNKAGLYRFDPVGDKFHHALPPGWRQARSSSGNKKKITSNPSVGIPVSTTSSSLGQFWGAPEGNQARAIAYGRARGRKITGWGTGPGQAQPFNFTSSPLFNQLVNRTARENGVDPQATASFLNMIMNITAMGETGLGTYQIGTHDKKDKGTFGIRDVTFNEVKGKSKYYGRGLDPNLQRKFATARDVYDLTTEEQALLVLTAVSGFKGPYRRIMQQGAQAVASGDRNAIRNALLNYITTLHWGGGSVNASIANVNRAIRGGAKWYGPSGEYFFNQRVAPMYLKRIDDYLNYISRGR